jgi:hypothetical protein
MDLKCRRYYPRINLVRRWVVTFVIASDLPECFAISFFSWQFPELAAF